MSWASHSSEKSRRWKTANIEGAGVGAVAAVMLPPAAPHRNAASSLPRTGTGPPASGPPSLPSALRDRDALAQEQLALALEAVLAFERPVAAVPAQGPIRRDHPMARDDERQGLPAHGTADGPGGPWRPDAPGDVAVARGLAEPELADRQQDPLVPIGSIGQVHRDVRATGRRAVEEALQDRSRTIQLADRGVAHR